MVTETIPTVTSFAAHAAANLFLSEHLPDRFCANDPVWDGQRNLWRVPVVLAYPFAGSVGQVGEIAIDASSEEVVSHTPFEEMKSRARGLYKQHRESIEAAFLQTRNS